MFSYTGLEMVKIILLEMHFCDYVTLVDKEILTGQRSGGLWNRSGKYIIESASDKGAWGTLLMLISAYVIKLQYLVA